MRYKKNNTSYGSIILIFLFLFSPIFSNYSFYGKISVGDFFVILVLIFSILNLKSLNIISFYGFISILFISIVDFILYLNYYIDGIMIMMRMSFYIITYFIISNSSIFKDFHINIIKYYVSICIIFSFILIIQNLFYYLFDKIIFLVDTPLDIEKSSLITLDFNTQGFRSGGLFREPSYFSIFIAPALFYAAILKRWYLYLYFSFAVILSTSTLGFVFILLTILDLTYSKISIKSLLLMFGIFVIFIFEVTDIISILPDRVMETVKGGGSLNPRVTEPFATIFKEDRSFIGPNFEILRNLSISDYPSNLWFNSFTYVIVVLGIFSILPVFFILANSEKRSFTFIAVLLVVTNSLSSPYFLVFSILFKFINMSLKCNNCSQKS